MKKIEAIIQPFMLVKVTRALQDHERVSGMTATDARGFGRQRAANAKDVISEGMIQLARKIKIEVVVSDDLVDEVVEIIKTHAHTGNVGDGKIFVTDVERAIRIRDFAEGEIAV